MKNFIDIFKQLWDHSENEVVEFKKARPTSMLTSWESISLPLAMKQTYEIMSSLGLSLVFGTRNTKSLAPVSKMVK